MTLKEKPSVIKRISRVIYWALKRNKKFPGSSSYWENRYSMGGNSGPGSYNRLAEFKAEALNSFVRDYNINRIIEFGCGDGNQLAQANYQQYIGLDVSPTAIKMCIDKFKADRTKSFFLYDSFCFADNHNLFFADLALSLDVLFHLVEDEVFEKYMYDLFNSSSRFVIIYATDSDEKQRFHMKERNFTRWIEQNISNFKVIRKIENRYKYNPSEPENTSKAEFFIYEKI